MSKYFKAGKGVKFIVNKIVGKKTSPTITSVGIKKNLTGRRKDFEDIIQSVDKHGKTAKSSKIKKDAAIKVSNIHTKYEKLKKVLDE